MAGVAVANTLQAAGMRDFLLLEATGRLGGRVREKTFYGICTSSFLSELHIKFINWNVYCSVIYHVSFGVLITAK